MRALAALALLGATGQADPHLPPPTYDTVAPTLPAGFRDGVLVFTKTNGWRHIEHLPHSTPVVMEIARGLGRPVFHTENAAVFDPALLARVRVVVLNSSSGDLFTPPQRAAFEAFLRGGGGLVALHAAGGDPEYKWRFYVEQVIGAQFVGHPGGEDHIQRATVRVVAPRHPVVAGLPATWQPRDEWYSFAAPPPEDSTILVTLDETTYRPSKGQEMGALHPIVWTRRLGRGRIVYSAIGHVPEAYDDPANRRLIRNAIQWAGQPARGTMPR
jgi:type 1 glutamine amidotransferase